MKLRLSFRSRRGGTLVLPAQLEQIVQASDIPPCGISLPVRSGGASLNKVQKDEMCDARNDATSTIARHQKIKTKIYNAVVNCFRNRTSFCEYKRRSFTRYFNWQTRSMPIPNAKPVYLFGSI